MQTLKKVIILNASPKAEEKTFSNLLSALGCSVIINQGMTASVLPVRDSLLKKRTEQDYADILSADGLVIVFPLYFFCLPAMLMRFLQDYAAFCLTHPGACWNKQVYGIVNCGFPEAEINREALEVLGLFSRAIGATFRGGMYVGGGPMLMESIEAPFMAKTKAIIEGAFESMARDMIVPAENGIGIQAVSMPTSRSLYFLSANRGWYASGSKNGNGKAALRNTPYWPKAEN